MKRAVFSGRRLDFFSSISRFMDNTPMTKDKFTREKHTNLFDVPFARHGAFRNKDPTIQGNYFIPSLIKEVGTSRET